MFNCYAVIFGGSPFAYFKTEIAADNFVTLFNSMRSSPANMKVEGCYIPNIAF